MTFTGTNVDTSREYGERAARPAGVTADNTVWYTWQSTINGLVTVTLDGSQFDTLLALYNDIGTVSTIRQVCQTLESLPVRLGSSSSSSCYSLDAT